MRSFLLSAILLMTPFLLSAQSRADSLRYVLTHPEEGGVMVAAHRGHWRGTAENSLEAIDAAVEAGLDIVEIDVRKTRDGVLVLMHDPTLGRTTDGKGRVSSRDYSYIRSLKLKGPGGDAYHVPTLEEALLRAKGRILVNLDMRISLFDDAYAVAHKTGTLGQVIFKTRSLPDKIRKVSSIPLDSILFMPKVPFNDSKARIRMSRFLSSSSPSAFELSAAKISSVTAAFYSRDHRLWYNALWFSFSDTISLSDPSAGWGHLVRWLHAGVIQTDYGPELKEYLKTIDQ